MSINTGVLTSQEANALVRRLEAVRDRAREFTEVAEAKGDLMLTFVQWEAYRRLREAIEEADRS